LPVASWGLTVLLSFNRIFLQMFFVLTALIIA